MTKPGTSSAIAVATWEQVLAHIEASLETFDPSRPEEITEFTLPDSMPPLPEQLTTRVAAIQSRITEAVRAHERELANLRTSLGAATRATQANTGFTIDERA